MPQYARPSADTYRDAWTEDDATTDALYAKIDEATIDDADYIKTPLIPTSDVYVTKLTTVEDPLSSTGHIIRYRYQKSASGGAQIDLTVQLRQTYTNEGAPGTLIKEWTHTDVANGFTTAAQTLSGAEADTITDYASLYLRFVGNQV